MSHKVAEAAVSKCSNRVAQKTALLDHLVGAGEQRRRNLQAEYLGSPASRVASASQPWKQQPLILHTPEWSG
jgi:hypothetical protein